MTDRTDIRPANRTQISELARIANAANANSVLHRRIGLYQDSYPTSYYHWRLLIIRQRFATADLRNFVAQDSANGSVLGYLALMVEGPKTPLYQEWTREYSWFDWIELKLIEAEKLWDRYLMNRSIDYKFLDRFFGAFFLDNKAGAGSEGATAARRKRTRPDCVHVHLIVVDPHIQARGVGKKLIEHAKRLAERENLPLYLESNFEATGFYDKTGFALLAEEMVVGLEGEREFRVPMYVWEGVANKGRWLEEDVSEQNDRILYKWKDEVLAE